MENANRHAEIVNLLLPYGEFAFFMGSYGTPRFHTESDIDIAVLFLPDVIQEQIWDIRRDLEKSFDRDVDLVDLRRIDPIFARQVLESGRLLFRRSKDKLLAWKAQQISKYIDFKSDRKIIEEHLLRRKKYG